MAIRNVTLTFRGLDCGYKECNRLSGACTVGIKNVTDCKGPVLWL